MSWSLNEVEALARKAARGAGYSFGLAEEAGKATRWLCAAGLPGTETLATLLTLNDARPYASCAPASDARPWQASGDALCPLITGAALCDRAAALATGDTVELDTTACPLLLLPFVASASDMSGAAIGITWPGLRMTRADRQTRLSAGEDALNLQSTGQITVGPGQPLDAPRLRRGYRAAIPPESLRVLNAFAHRTYAPDTPESRLSGAGAGLSDND